MLKFCWGAVEMSGGLNVVMTQMIFDVRDGIGPLSNVGIWVETEMEDFRCIQCGHCCLHLADSYCTSAYEEDIVRWKEEGRRDILEYVVVGDLWISPRTNKDVDRCPWLTEASEEK